MFTPHQNLYHYTSSETFLDYILPSMSLKMGSYRRLNDPREAKDWRFTIYLQRPESTKLFYPELMHELSAEITDKSLVLCFSADSRIRTSADDHLNAGYGRPRMWAQYAKGHTGVCIVFDKALLENTVHEILGANGLYWGPVEYLANPPDGHHQDIVYLETLLQAGIASYMQHHVEIYHRSLFFTKHHDWHTENEYRWVFRSPNRDAHHLIPIQKCIKAVIIGNDANNPNEISKRCAEVGIPTFMLHQKGWGMTLLDRSEVPQTAICLDGVGFSQNIPCRGVFVTAFDMEGKFFPFFINNEGEMIIAAGREPAADGKNMFGKAPPK